MKIRKDLMRNALGLLILLFLLTIGCSHPLTVKNLSSYSSKMQTPLEKPLTIGIIPNSGDMNCETIIKEIPQALGNSGADTIIPYHQASSRQVDVIADVTLRPEYKGSGWNFLINWPGFLVFAPAWHGYVYKVKYDADIALTDASSKQQISSFSLPIELNIRHAAMNRTWTELSYLEVSAIALIGGIVFVDFDDNVSELTANKVKDVIGEYIAQEIIRKLRASGKFACVRMTISATG